MSIDVGVGAAGAAVGLLVGSVVLSRVMAQLDRWGPSPSGAGEAGTTPTLDESRAFCRSLTLGHRENFSVLSRLVPDRLRDDFAAVYAFCRWADDLGDETGADAEARARSSELLAWWRAGLSRCFAAARGESQPPPHPVFVALADTARRHALDERPFDDLIGAFEQDQRVTRYRTWDELRAYCARSADPVGRIVLALGGVRGGSDAEREMIAMSDATCTALQLINFWQDVRRDLDDRDRVYLPSDETGLDAETLRDWADRPRDPEARVPYIRALRPLVERTAELFERGAPLPGAMRAHGAGELAPVVWLFGAGGRATLRAVERIGCATLWRRPTLSRGRRAMLVARAAVARIGARRTAA